MDQQWHGFHFPKEMLVTDDKGTMVHASSFRLFYHQGEKTSRARAKASIMTDAMLESVKVTQKTVATIGLLAVLMGVLFALNVPRGIIKVLGVISRQMDESAYLIKNASNAEESASACEEMNAQAGQMKDLVRALTVMVGGRPGIAHHPGKPGVMAKRIGLASLKSIYRTNEIPALR